MTNFQKIISDIVAKEPLRQVGVAEKLGITDAYVSNFVTGTRKLSKKIAQKLEDVYGLNSSELLAIQKLEEAELLSNIKPDKKTDALNQLGKIQNGKNKTNANKIVPARVSFKTVSVLRSAIFTVFCHLFCLSKFTSVGVILWEFLDPIFDDAFTYPAQK